MSRQTCQSAIMKPLGMAVLLSLLSGTVLSGAVLSPAQADELESGDWFDPGLSDGPGIGIDFSVGGTLGGSSRPVPPTPPNASEPTDGEQAATAAKQPASQPEVRLYGDRDSAFGVEILNHSGHQNQRVRIGIPFL